MFHEFSALQLFSTKDTGACQPLLLLLNVRSHFPHRPLRTLAEQAVEGAVLGPAVHGQKCPGAACLLTDGTRKGAGMRGESTRGTWTGGTRCLPGQVVKEEVARRLAACQVEVVAPGALHQTSRHQTSVPLLPTEVEAGA